MTQAPGTPWNVRPLVLFIVSCLLLVPGTVRGQSTGAIAGAVTDTTGAVLPGVTAEAASPALIEGVRSVITDSQGRYSIEGLPPGTYTVTFTLSGFTKFRREGVQLSAGFTAPVNAQMQVGSLAETVTVTGASPTIDVKNVRTQNVLSDETLRALPSAQNLSAFAALTLGMTFSGTQNGSLDLGGSGGEIGAGAVHNNRTNDQKILLDGMSVNVSRGVGGGNLHYGFQRNALAIEEVAIGTNSMSAETETAGVQVNNIYKRGGDKLSATGIASYTNGHFQADDLTDDLRARGASSPQKVKRIWDYGAGVGGPVVKGRAWFYTAHRWWGGQEYVAGSFFNAIQGQKAPNGRPLYAPGEQGYSDATNREYNGRVTWQVSDKDKLTNFASHTHACTCLSAISPTLTPEATPFNSNTAPTNFLDQVIWTRAQSNRVLLEGGYTFFNNPYIFERTVGVGEHDIAIQELSPALFYNAAQTTAPYNHGNPAQHGQMNGRASASYVTGSHSFKGGFSFEFGSNEETGSFNALEGFGPTAFTLNGGVPVQLTLFNHPVYREGVYRNVAFYGQDQWVIKRLTLNLGVRNDLFNGWVRAGEVPATAYLPAYRFDRIEGVPSWRDISPRLGAAFDVFGNGKTAVKASAGRYVESQAAGLPQSISPASSISRQTTRSWIDANNNFFPDCDPRNALPNGECGASTNPNFGQPVITSFWADDYLKKNRPGGWQFSTGVDHEVVNNLRVSIEYFRTTHFNQTVVDNESVGPQDYDPYCVTVPAGLPNSGQKLCGFADITAAARLRPLKSTTKNAEASFGKMSEVFNGVDFELRGRFPRGATLQGGVSVGRAVTDRCFVVDSPQELYQCRVVSPWWNGGGQIKLSGSYPLPFGIALSAVYQNIQPQPIQAAVTYFNADIAPSLGRNLSTCPASTGACNSLVTLNVLTPNAAYESRVDKLDFRVMKNVRTPAGRLRFMLDLYNALNRAAILARNNSFGTTGVGWGRVISILGGRLAKLSLQYDF